jgi:hypothetical protein
MSGGSSNNIPSATDMVASKANADLINQQWEDYKTRFVPQENKLIDQMGTGLQTKFLPKALDNAQTGVNNAFTSANGQQARDLSRYGQTQTTDQATAQATNSSLAQSASLANANNTAIQNDQNLRTSVLSGGLGAAAYKGKN